jgi:hypothetical protein
VEWARKNLDKKKSEKPHFSCPQLASLLLQFGEAMTQLSIITMMTNAHIANQELMVLVSSVSTYDSSMGQSQSEHGLQIPHRLQWPQYPEATCGIEALSIASGSEALALNNLTSGQKGFMIYYRRI